MNGIIELYCKNVANKSAKWQIIAQSQTCPLLDRKCLKNRKSEPEKTIGTCIVEHSDKQLLICPHRLIENNVIFKDCLHLLTKHEPGNEYHVVSEVSTAAGNIDYMLASVRNHKVVDFVGIELQTMDTTGTVYPLRERFLKSVNVQGVDNQAASSAKPFGINWKMTAKTILVQLHHKIGIFEEFNKTLVLVLQDHLLDYMRAEFSFAHFEKPSLGNSMHFHAYEYGAGKTSSSIALSERISTDAQGINTCLGLNTNNRVELEELLSKIQEKISAKTLLRI